jgi:hypothetical protein
MDIQFLLADFDSNSSLSSVHRRQIRCSSIPATSLQQKSLSRLDTSSGAIRKRARWSPEEDALVIDLRGGGMKWEDISKRFSGRSPLSCRLRYQNHLERPSERDEGRKDELTIVYDRYSPYLVRD